MSSRMTPWFLRPFSRLRSERAPERSHLARAVPGFEAMENRLVLSGFHGDAGLSLLSTLNSVGVVTGPVQSAPGDMPTSTNSRIAQFQADFKKLTTDLQGLASKSSVSVADINAIANDSEAILQAGAYLDRDALKKVISDLAVAVASNSDTSQAKTAFTALFTGTSVSTTVIDQTFSDLVKLIQDSGVTADDLKMISGDTAAIQADADGQGHGPGDGLGPPSAAFDGGFGHDRGTLLAGLNGLGVVTNPSLGPIGGSRSPGPRPRPDFDWGSASTTGSQLQADIEKLQTDLEGLAAKSRVTVAELNALALDQQAIADAGVHLDPAALNSALGAITGAVVAGSDTAQAKATFNAALLQQHDSPVHPGPDVRRYHAGDPRLQGDPGRPAADLRRPGQHPHRPGQPRPVFARSTNADGTPCNAGSGSSGGTSSSTGLQRPPPPRLRPPRPRPKQRPRPA
ncbi:MAG: hypothetical protein U0800_02365 [Isosphaeraceae bacterium]